MGFTYKSKSVNEAEPPQEPFVLDSRTNPNLSMRTSRLRIYQYWIHVQTKIRQRRRAVSGVICIGFAYKPRPGSEDEQPQVT